VSRKSQAGRWASLARLVAVASLPGVARQLSAPTVRGTVALPDSAALVAGVMRADAVQFDADLAVRLDSLGLRYAWNAATAPGRGEAAHPPATPAPAPAAHARPPIAPQGGDSARARVEFTVRDREGAALSDVQLELLPDSGPLRGLGTDALGRAVFEDLRRGVVRVRARRIGYETGEVTVALAAGLNVVTVILDDASPPTLDTVRILGDRIILTRHEAFESRRVLGLTTRSITREEIERRDPVAAWHLLTNVPALTVINVGGEVRASARRSLVTSFLSPGKVCFFRVMVDGVLYPDDAPDLGRLLPPPDEIHGIEIFAGPASIPAQYGGSGNQRWCGLIAVWTR
jgi:hypothetical protein